jgi:glycosyltransferase involved in cell wall biosynthesis
MKVLFVCSGNLTFGISPFIKSQGDSLVKKGVELEYFTIKGKGFFGYLRNIWLLRKILKKNNYDIVHSHYSFSSYVVSLAGAKNQIVSLMGSDVNSGFFKRVLIKFFNTIFWKVCIVKSEDMKRKIGIKDALIVPNGVDLDKFKYIDRAESCRKVGFNPTEKHLVFAASPERIEKNFQLAKKAFELLQVDNVNLKIVSDVKHDLIPYYFNAADVLVLTSIYEGSPNVVKEGMACNCPIVSTDVGDVRWVFGDTEGYFVSSNSPEEFAKYIQVALNYKESRGRTKGHKRILELGLNSETIAEEIIGIYRKVLVSKKQPVTLQKQDSISESMKVIFVCRRSFKFGIVPFIRTQGESLKNKGIELEYFVIEGKGLKSYLNSMRSLKKQLKKKSYDLVHAHYVFCGWVAVLAARFQTPVIASYMGSDTYGSYNEKGKRVLKSIIVIILAKILQPFIKKIIVKSKNLHEYVYLKYKSALIPNGVNLNVFKQMDKKNCRKILNLDLDKKYILFLGDIEDPRKNFGLLKRTMDDFNGRGEILAPYPVEAEKIPIYLNASDIIALFSYNEGSPNVIKEAMACNCPIVSTDVGDVRWVFGDTEGCYLTSFDPKDVAEKLKKALEFSENKRRTLGRKRIKELKLDAGSVAESLLDVYKGTLKTG